MSIESEAWVVAKITRKTKSVAFLQTDSSHSWFGSDLSGNFTRKFTSNRAALEVMGNFRAQSMQSVYDFKVMTFSQAQNLSGKEGDGGNYEPDKMSPTGVGIK